MATEAPQDPVNKDEVLEVLEKLAEIRKDAVKRLRASQSSPKYRRACSWAVGISGVLIAVPLLLGVVHQVVPLPNWGKAALAFTAASELAALVGLALQVASEISVARNLRRVGAEQRLAEYALDIDASRALAGFDDGVRALADKLLEQSIKRIEQQVLIFVAEKVSMPLLIGVVLTLGTLVPALIGNPWLWMTPAVALIALVVFLAAIGRRREIESLTYQRQIMERVALTTKTAPEASPSGVRSCLSQSGELRLAPCLVPSESNFQALSTISPREAIDEKRSSKTTKTELPS